jgi:hypothetical protein
MEFSKELIISLFYDSFRRGNNDDEESSSVYYNEESGNTGFSCYPPSKLGTERLPTASVS